MFGNRHDSHKVRQVQHEAITSSNPCIPPVTSQERSHHGETLYTVSSRKTGPVTVIDDDATLERDISQFKKIYAALYAGESSLFKQDIITGTDHLTPRQFFQKIIIDKPDDRARFAWHLTLKHANTIKQDANPTVNPSLFKDIYLYAFEKSGIFKRSKLFGNSIFSIKKLRSQLMTLNDDATQTLSDTALDRSRAAAINRILK
tara:strand:+ start:458 stop:1066 length:609 start_codon:yes stop_codon:yes gene_type:complete